MKVVVDEVAFYRKKARDFGKGGALKGGEPKKLLFFCLCPATIFHSFFPLVLS